MTSQNARLYVLIARSARRAVVFRRGPSRSVLVLEWNLREDMLIPGQWFSGRVYERRCDLSPAGDLLSYFAASYRSPLQSWTAISRPPYLTALALWPKGDAWGGGALFQDDRTLQLNHFAGADMRLAEGFTIPDGFEVNPLGEHSGRGEDEPILTTRLERDGWVPTSSGERSDHDRSASMIYGFNPPRIIEKPLRRSGLRLRVSTHGLGEQGGTWYVQTGQIVGPGGVLEDFGRIDWLDADHNGDVLIARNGRLFRRTQRQLRPERLVEPPKLVADLNELRFKRCSSPDTARAWPKSARAKRRLA